MLTVHFFAEKGTVYGFRIKGHADYADCGRDIVCAAVSSAAYMTANTLTEIMNVQTNVSASDSSGMTVLVDRDEADLSALQLLKGFELHIKSMKQEYPENIKVIYGGVRNA